MHYIWTSVISSFLTEETKILSLNERLRYLR